MYNRYSYVRNNPLNATDPSGYFWKELDKLNKKVGRSLIRAAVKIFGAEIVNLVGSAVSSYYGGAIGQALWSYEFSRAMGASSSQALRGAAITYVTAVVSYSVQDMNWASQALIKGFVGGVAAELQGGKFGHGFASASLSSLAGNIGPVDSGASIGNVDVGQVAVDAVVGGTISEITGGKFANGARSAAYASILRQLTSPARVKKNEQDRETVIGPKSNAANPGGCTGGQPVNFSNGDKYFVVLDGQANGGSGLKFERYYNSTEYQPTAMGGAWRHNFDRRLQFTGSAEMPVAVTAEREQGEPITFLPEGGEWQAQRGNFDQLQKTEDGWQLILTDNSIEFYSNAGELQAIEYLGGYTQQLSYKTIRLADGSKVRRLQQVRDSLNNVLELAYNADGLLVSSSINNRVVAYYRYNEKHNLVRVSYPDATPNNRFDNPSIIYQYSDSRYVNAITAVLNETGEVVHTIAYDDRGRAVLSKAAGSGYRLRFNGNQTEVTYSLGRTNVFTFDNNNQVVAVEGKATDSCLAANKDYRYNHNGQLISQTGWNDTETRFEYNARGLETRRIVAAGTPEEYTVTTEWHPEWRLPVKVEEPGRTLKLRYNAQGLLTHRTELDTQGQRNWLARLAGRYPARSWHYTYNTQGLLTAVDGPRTDVSDITRYEYNQQGQHIAAVNALGHRSEVLAFNQQGLPTELVNANGVSTYLSYNARGWLTGQTTAKATTRYYYTSASAYNGGGKGISSKGLVSRVEQANGSSLSYHYDKGGRITSVSNHLGERINYTLDAVGNRVAETLYSSSGEILGQQQAVYDELGRLLLTVGADGATQHYSYDKAGNRIGSADGLGQHSQFAYDALNRLVQTTDALGGIIAQTYNAQGQLSSVTDQRGLTTHYRYNGFGDKVAQISPDTGTTEYQYDPAGNLVARLDAEQRHTSYRYDALNRITAIEYANAANDNIYYQYDKATGSHYAIGRLVQVNDASGHTQYSYNAHGQLTMASYQVGEQHYRQQYRYNTTGQLLAVVYPGGREVEYQTANGQLQAINTRAASPLASSQKVISQLTTKGFGQLASLRYGNGLQLHHQHDKNRRIQGIRVSNAANDAVFNRQYNYNAVGNITAIDDAIAPQYSEHYQYDALNRLHYAQGHYGRVSYSFDAVGNRTEREVFTPEAGSPVLEHYQYDHSSNRLLAVNRNNKTPRTLAYDASGNMVADNRNQQNRALIYGANNRLQTVADKDFSTEYVYNAKGQRVIKRVNRNGAVVETHFHYNHANQLVAETAANGLPVREYLYTGTMRVAMVGYQNSAEGELYYVHNDHLGTPRVMTDAAANIVWAAYSTPFGETDIQADNINNPLRFPGQYADDETGYSYNYFRDYEPSLGRYIQSDPIGLAGGVNTFGYVLGNPLNRIDLFGVASYLVSRPLDGLPGALGYRHLFIVHHSTGPGTGIVVSFGRTSSGLMGRVDSNTKGMSDSTSKTDKDWWGKDYNKEDVRMTEILATDATIDIDDMVALAANLLIADQEYKLRGVNSNAGAQAVANYGAEADVLTPKGKHPGVEYADKVNFAKPYCTVDDV